MATIEQLKQYATTIKKEVVEGENTAMRVGVWMEEAANIIGSTEKDIQAINKKLQERTIDKVFGLDGVSFNWNEVLFSQTASTVWYNNF